MKIESGKAYKNKYGQIVFIININPKYIRRTYKGDDGFLYDENGKVSDYFEIQNPYKELIEEVKPIEEPGEDKVPNLQLEVGKYYLRRDGEICKIENVQCEISMNDLVNEVEIKTKD
ncbi:MAG: hypothetical protein A3E87_01790 [Gammaproteobacteria bacterium RIFCSPHIGHO2_12_FULL_35_23]|nr:MAG: hypothetical protein A3E87_01790 [Gammaproteobacteria bacterium RIFCSPHIGHO2_12_FULL_35_23]